jgi:hypothetical protein
MKFASVIILFLSLYFAFPSEESEDPAVRGDAADTVDERGTEDLDYQDPDEDDIRYFLTLAGMYCTVYLQYFSFVPTLGVKYL